MGDRVELPTRLSYGVDKTRFIRQALAGYTGGAAIASEMIQNADDAGASCISFHFRTGALGIHNSSSFTEKDFLNITNIARGKGTEEGKIGTWGTGFLSVFHITDMPQLLSAGYRIEFDPSRDSVHPVSISHHDGTTFRLPWRQQETELSRDLEATVWSDEEIGKLRDAIVALIYRLAIFLRHVRVIEVYEGNEEENRIARVERRLLSEEKTKQWRRELWEIEYQRTGVQKRIDTWCYYRDQISPGLAVAHVKDREVALAFPLEGRDWLTENVPGTLYNFLPTPIETDFAFQINGAFFPDSNRNSILMDEFTHREKSRWNRQVLKTLGSLFCRANLDIRDQVQQPRRFYELLPVLLPPYDFLRPIHDMFVESASQLPIVFTSLNKWQRPAEVLIGMPASRLPQLIADYLPILPAGATQDFRDFLANTLSCQRLMWDTVIKYLQPRLRKGQRLAETHPMINSYEKLELLYGELPTFPNAEQRQSLCYVPLCLEDDDTLEPFEGNVWRADEATRRLVSGEDIHFVHTEMQALFPRLFESLVRELTGSALVDWLYIRRWPDTPFSWSSAPSLVGEVDRLGELLRFVSGDLRRVDAQKLAALPIVRTEDDLLCCGVDGIYWHGDAHERAILGTIGLVFVHPEWQRDPYIEPLYRKAGVGELRPRHVIAALRERLQEWSDLPQEELIQHLVPLYDYFGRHFRELAPVDVESLRGLPICLTQQGRLVSVESEGEVLHLSSVGGRSDSEALAHLDKLQLDNLVHSGTLSAGRRQFFRQVLKLVELSHREQIRSVILPHYHDERLDDADRQVLLGYISKQMQDFPESVQRQLWPELIQARLIRCNDGGYRRGEEVYFASPALDVVFVNGYHCLHPDYGVPVAGLDDIEQFPYRQHSTWYWSLRNLGVNEVPASSHLVHTVEKVVASGPPTDERVDAVRRVYDLLNREIADNVSYSDSDTLKRLAYLRWLPARGDDRQWHAPKDIYQASHTQFVGDQAPLLRFGESIVPLRRFLGMSAFPPAAIVANHLLAIAGQRQPVQPLVYEDLGRRWEELEQEIRQRLRQEAVVWDGDRRFWIGQHVYFGDYHQLFGARRCYLKPPGGNAQVFLLRLGAQVQPDLWRAHVELLEEIAADYVDRKVVSEEDLTLLTANYDHMGRQEELDGESLANLSSLSQLAIIAGHNRCLHLPNRIVFADQREWLSQFDEYVVPVVDDEELTESAYLFLRSLGVRSLSQVIQRCPVGIQGSYEDLNLSLHLNGLVYAFRRIALTVSEQRDDRPRTDLLVDKLTNVSVRACADLSVKYCLDDGQGWHIQGHSRPELALYDAHDNVIYVKRQGSADQLPLVPLARELERFLFPDSKESIVIERLLSLSLSEVDNYLDQHGYRRPYETEIMQDGEDVVDIALPDWYAGDDDTPAPWEQEEQQPEELIEPGPLDVADFPSEPEIEKLLTEGEEDSAIEQAELIPVEAGASFLDQQPEEDIPVFTGRRRPAVPVLPNHYGELQQKFGLPQSSSQLEAEVSSEEMVSSDLDWELETTHSDEVDLDVDRVSQVRFTLTFTNRYEGFLPLHTRAKQMLVDQPRLLHCQTDFEEWAFELYVDYAEDIIYNQKELPRFFDAHNIPAGGIVYLEQVHGNIVRLFWRPMSSRVQNVRCLELREDGTLEVFEIEAVEFPCEVSEYVLRAEKRLEDPEALFMQALGKRGAFQTICEVFGKPGKELSYKEIFQGVTARRQVADATIRAQLQQRPCFLPIGGSRWRFEPDRGSEPVSDRRSRDEQIPDHIGVIPGSEASQEQSAVDEAQGILRPVPAPYHDLLVDVRRRWKALDGLFQLTDRDAHQALNELARGLTALVQRLQNDLEALDLVDAYQDEVLVTQWQDLRKDFRNTQAQHRLRQYIQQQLARGDQSQRKGVLACIRHQLASTASSHRELVVFPLLGQLAAQFTQDGHIVLARDLYGLLQRQGAGNFGTQLLELEKLEDVKLCIDLARDAKDLTERWNLWADAWRKHPGVPLLRQAIQDQIRSELGGVDRQVRSCLQKSGTRDACSTYTNWAKCIHLLEDAWLVAPVTASVWKLARYTFDGQLDYARVSEGESLDAYRYALCVAATMPVSESLFPPSEDYLEAILAVSEHLEEQNRAWTAIGLLEYGLYAAKSAKTTASDSEYIVRKTHERAGRLYEQYDLLEPACYHLESARRRVVSQEQKRLLGNRLYELGRSIKKQRSQGVGSDWENELEALLNDSQFCELVREKEFVKMLKEVHKVL